MIDFESFPKMPRLNRECVITEKIDGTNAQIYIVSKDSEEFFSDDWDHSPVWEDDNVVILAGSRTRWISPGKTTDNYGFAGWVQQNGPDLAKLGAGRHFGEWWGQGIQRTYGLAEKRFSLFNVGRFTPANAPDGSEDSVIVDSVTGNFISCCHVVPTLYRGPFRTSAVESMLLHLRDGSLAAPGFSNPEGIIVWHEAAKHGFKVTLENDEQPKSFAIKGD